jgi:hypothetical protein
VFCRPKVNAQGIYIECRVLMWRTLATCDVTEARTVTRGKWLGLYACSVDDVLPKREMEQP